MTLAELIEQQRDEIIERWLAKARDAASARELSQPELRNVFPLYLSSLGEGRDVSGKLEHYLENHLAGRIRQGFDVVEMVDELVWLEQSIIASWMALPPEERPSDAERQTLAAEIQRSTVMVARIFDEHMQLDEQHEKRYIRLLQNLADAALRTPDDPLTAQLKDVLDLILEATGADSATISLYSPVTQELMASASSGLAERSLEEFASAQKPPSLTSLIASSPEPTEVADVETTELNVDESLRHSGIHSLLGVRLPPRHKLTAVLYIGLRERRSFRAREIRRFEALGDMLSLHLDNARLYADLRRNIEVLKTERELRERFVAILAHDLRGPLSTAKMGVQMLAHNHDLGAEPADLAIRVERNLDRIDRMIRDLLDVSRVQTGERLPLRLESCDLGNILEGVVEELAGAYGPRFRLVPTSIRGVWSADDLHRALWNLGVNAVKYGSRDGAVTLRADPVADGVCIAVHNTGESIEPEEQARIFDVYSRGRTSGREDVGWGLGLAWVRACAEAHGGSVAVHSDPRSGTTFSISLPRDARPFQASSSKRSEAAPAEQPQS